MRLNRGSLTLLLALAVVVAACSPGSRPGRPSTSRPPKSTRPVPPLGSKQGIVAAVGDVSCAPNTPVDNQQCQMAATEGIAAAMKPDVVALAGDLQYERGSLAAFRESWARSWGALDDRVRPAVGNHEYGTSGAAGYWAYWGARAGEVGKGWYSYSVGSWHVVALNSNCGRVGCEAGSAQLTWLARDLKEHPSRCTLAYWHHPRYSSGLHGSDATLDPLWRVLDEAGVDVVVTGHDHHYERFAPQAAGGVADGNGVREFVAGTGGRNLYPMIGRIANSEAGTSSTFGVLQLTLRAEGYEWDFVPTSGSFRDQGSATCTTR